MKKQTKRQRNRRSRVAKKHNPLSNLNGEVNECQQNKQKRQRLEDRLADKASTWEGFRAVIQQLATGLDEYAGVPTPIGDINTIVHPSFGFSKFFSNQAEDKAKKDPEYLENAEYESKCQIINEFWSWRYRTKVMIFRDPNGKLDWVKSTRFGNQASMLLNTMSVIGSAWDLEQETKALEILYEKITDHQFKTYIMSGCFAEQSKVSGVNYFFRRLRPTIAVTTKGGGFKDMSKRTPRILCTLCLHPIGYYEDSWSGALCPTDDVLAHLMLMRADEKLYWKRANQHPSYLPQSGI
jgi:hypothetical protein